ncbi:hypothetical protein GCM10011495_39180 [Hymenobacter frigidus]|uniref:Integrase catalytic domain-containing protein n=1 Tax=Hymenobacter frigidus TaxID=1524095 RepID=A0ABQ2AH81_9BACT|nr:hypothetical protein GCM10011495_39180 [Hymenobacter frigidus]
MAGLTTGPPSATTHPRNSSRVASGCWRKQATNSARATASSSGAGPLRGGSAANAPFARWRCNSQPRPTRANRVWVSDSTYLPLANGTWAYLCDFKDVCTKHVVGWQVRPGMPKALVTCAMQRALLAQRPALPGTTQAESRWSRLKTEALEARDWSVFSDLADAQASIAEYFDYYNHDRCHSSIGY